MRILWLIVLLLCGATASAQASDPSEARIGEFGAKLLITDDPEGFWKAWEGPTPPHITTTSKIMVLRPVHAMVVFHDCSAAANGKCNVMARFELRKPDGQLYDKPLTAPAWTEAPAPGHNLLASLASMGFELEPGDPLGRYQVTVTLTDEVAGKSVTVRQEVTAEGENAPPPSTI